MKKQPRRISTPLEKTPPNASGRRRTTLTLKQRQFMDGKLQGKSSAAAARAAGYAESVARKADEIISGSSHMQAAMAEILHAAGITDELLAERIWQGLNATIVSKKTAYARREVLVDYRERREMVELVLRLKGELTNKHEIQPTGDWPTKIVIEYVGAKCDSCGRQRPARLYGSRHLCDECENKLQENQLQENQLQDSPTSNSNSGEE